MTTAVALKTVDLSLKVGADPVEERSLKAEER